MEKYEYKGHTFEIYVDEVGTRFNWYFIDKNGKMHGTPECETTEFLALSAAKDSIRLLVDRA